MFEREWYSVTIPARDEKELYYLIEIERNGCTGNITLTAMQHMEETVEAGIFHARMTADDLEEVGLATVDLARIWKRRESLNDDIIRRLQNEWWERGRL